MSNSGTSYKFVITKEPLKKRYQANLKKYTLSQVNPPSTQIVSNGIVSYALTKWVNPFPDIAFQKIQLPKYDFVPGYNAAISNEPDYIKDYHFIALMRCIDFYNAPQFKALIKGKATGVKT